MKPEKDKSKKGHVDVSPLTYSPRGFSRPRFIITLFLTIIVSLSLIVGGTLTFFSFNDDSFVTVNGKELITADIADSIRNQLAAQTGLSEQQKMGAIMQMLGPREESLMWTLYGEKKGISFKAADLYKVLRPSYEETKENYQKEYKSYFTFSYPDFVKNNVDNVNLQTILKLLSIPSMPDHYNIIQEYTTKKTSSILSYTYTNAPLYVLKMQKDKVSDFYQKNPQKQYIASKVLKVLPFTSSLEADDKAKEWNRNTKKIDEAFAKAQVLTLSSKKDSDAYIYVQSVDIGQLTPSFSYRGKVYLGQVSANNYSAFSELDPKDQLLCAKDYVKTLKKVEKEAIEKTIQNDLDSNQTKPYILKGKTNTITLDQISNITDSRSLASLPFASAKNKDFLQYAFLPKGYETPLLSYDGTYYKLKVINHLSPTFPISSTESKKIQDEIKERENTFWLLYHRKAIQEGMKVKINTKNIQSLLGA